MATNDEELEKEVADRVKKQVAIIEKKAVEFHAAIGYLTIAWAQLETLLYKVVLHYGNISPAVGRALLSGSRARNLMKFLLAIVDNTAMPRDHTEDLKHIFAQATAINTARDRIIHSSPMGFSAMFFGEEQSFDQTISNEERAIREKSGYQMKVSADSINAMIADIHAICQRLHDHLDKTVHHFPDPKTRPAWLYKFPAPEGKKASSRSSVHRPKDRHSRSGEK